MTEPLEGELLPAIRAPSAPVPPHGPTHRHGICHKAYRGTLPPWPTLCGMWVFAAADLRRQDLPKCRTCLTASDDHALHCDCWTLFPSARLPRA